VWILGISTMTDSAAVLMHEGRVVSACEEERFRRVKHAAGFPYRAIATVLASQRLTLADVDHVAIAWNPFKLGHRAMYLAGLMLSDPAYFSIKLRRAMTVWKGMGESGEEDDSGWGSLYKTRRLLIDHLHSTPRKIHFLDHHACHMASCFFGSDFPEAALLVMDGTGEAACTTWGVGRGISLETLDQHLLPHSLGHYYSAITGYLGFKMLDGEYKLMGLSPCGDPRGANWIRQNFLKSNGEGRYHLTSKALDYHEALSGKFHGSFVDHFGPARAPTEDDTFGDRHRDVAAACQSAFEEVVLEMGRRLHALTALRQLCIAGGCGLNCCASGKLVRLGLYDQIYVPPVAHDAGGALGAAQLLFSRLTGTRPAPITGAAFGPSFDDAAILSALQTATVDFQRLNPEELVDRCARTLTVGGVVSWFQGAMEYGPRALGQRSILADPRSDSVVELLNRKIKKREPFRPFAPSVKAERASEFFELDQPSPFMTLVVPVRPGKRSVIPAVTHVDGTARPQTVDRDENALYWQLLDRFEALTGVPVVLNTSFNIQEPIVCTPDEALATFGRSGLDAMCLGNYWVTPLAAERGCSPDRP